MLGLFKKLTRKDHEPARLVAKPPALRVILTEDCLGAIGQCLAREIRKGHEGVVFLLGRTDGSTTLVVSVFKPQAITTPGSFDVDAVSMAPAVRAAANQGLQVVGQAHTHPDEAFHSDGDERGARIRYAGFVSLVFPHYGRDLPSLEGTACYMHQPGQGFVTLKPHELTLVQARIT
jgi:proteasome lid subunit RPN8/RPN11